MAAAAASVSSWLCRRSRCGTSVDGVMLSHEAGLITGAFRERIMPLAACCLHLYITAGMLVVQYACLLILRTDFFWRWWSPVGLAGWRGGLLMFLAGCDGAVAGALQWPLLKHCCQQQQLHLCLDARTHTAVGIANNHCDVPAMHTASSRSWEWRRCHTRHVVVPRVSVTLPLLCLRISLLKRMLVNLVWIFRAG